MTKVTFLWHGFPDLPKVNKWNLIRQYRNELLARSDKLVVIALEANTSPSTKIKEYRQKLRDVPQDFTDPDLAELPEL